jgi:hypothetical protein
LIETISQLSPIEQDRIRVAVAEGRNGAENNPDTHISKRRKTVHGCDREEDREFGPEQVAPEAFVDTEFLKPQTHNIVEQCIANFIDRTGNAALTTATCIACAKELVASNTQVMCLGAIPNSRWLEPREPHPKHHLTNGMLLHHWRLRVRRQIFKDMFARSAWRA